jgi:hypothetical protein
MIAMDWIMKALQLKHVLIYTFLALLIAAGGAVVGWCAAGKYQTKVFWHVDSLDHSALDHTILLNGYKILLCLSRASERRRTIGSGRTEFSLEIWPTESKKFARNWYLFFRPKGLSGFPEVMASGGPMAVRDTNAWIDYGLTGKFCIKFDGATSLEYYRITNRWVAAKNVGKIISAGRLPVLIWHGVRYYFSLHAGCWVRKTGRR